MRRLGWWTALLAALATPAVAQNAADERPTAVVIYADRDNGFAAAALLVEAGIAAKPRPIGAIDAAWTTDADLVVALSCCPGGWGRDTSWGTLLDRIGAARVVACGDTGAALLATRKLLVGHPHGAHWPNAPVSAHFSRAELAAVGSRILEAPHALGDANADDVVVAIQSNVERLGSAVELFDGADVNAHDVEHIGVFDGGAFPEGSQGLGRMAGERRHWVICRQGNYTLWGADVRLEAMTDEGRQLFANVCWEAATMAPRPLVFPQPVMIEERVEGLLKGGGRAVYHHTIARTGRIRIRLAWEGQIELMLMTHEAFVRRVDGHSPVEIAFPLNEVMLGRNVEIEVGSFVLPEGEELPFELTVAWDD